MLLLLAAALARADPLNPPAVGCVANNETACCSGWGRAQRFAGNSWCCDCDFGRCGARCLDLLVRDANSLQYRCLELAGGSFEMQSSVVGTEMAGFCWEGCVPGHGVFDTVCRCFADYCNVDFTDCREVRDPCGRCRSDAQRTHSIGASHWEIRYETLRPDFLLVASSQACSQAEFRFHFIGVRSADTRFAGSADSLQRTDAPDGSVTLDYLFTENSTMLHVIAHLSTVDKRLSVNGSLPVSLKAFQMKINFIVHNWAVLSEYLTFRYAIYSNGHATADEEAPEDFSFALDGTTLFVDNALLAERDAAVQTIAVRVHMQSGGVEVEAPLHADPHARRYFYDPLLGMTVRSKSAPPSAWTALIIVLAVGGVVACACACLVLGLMSRSSSGYRHLQEDRELDIFETVQPAPRHKQRSWYPE